MSKEKSVKNKFIERLNEDRSIDWKRENLTTRSLILDVLYLLGVSVDQEKYQQHSGFQQFLDENGVSLNLVKTPVNPTPDGG